MLERASARETAARVAVGACCKAFLAELGIGVLSHVVQIGSVKLPARARPFPELADLDAIDASPVRCIDESTAERMVDEIDQVRRSKDTVGGVFEVVAYGAPPGLGSYVHYDRKLDARLALALMSIQSVKGVEVGDGFATAGRTGSKAHDEIVHHRRSDRPEDGARRRDRGRHVDRPADPPACRHEAVLHRTASARHRGPGDRDRRRGYQAAHRRVRRARRAVVVGEAVVAFELANAVLEKFGGDSLAETRRNLEAYVETIA